MPETRARDLANIASTATGGIEGTEVKSTGESGGAKYLREDGDGTSSWQTVVQPTAGISNGNYLTANANVADDDFLRVDGTAVEGRTAAETLSDIGAAPLASPTFTGTTNVSSGVTLPSNPTIVLGSNATLPAGTFIQAVTGTGANNSGVTHNGSTFTTLETLSTTITVNKGNKVLIIATGVPWYTSGTTNHNGIVRLRISDGTNEGVTNGCILLTQNFSINNKRMYGSNHTGIMTTASGSGTVVVTATVQASTESGATVNYGDTNTLTALNYTLFEIQA